ncbi:MAG: hypothetical protein ACOX5W_00965 [Bacillota bacterium]
MAKINSRLLPMLAAFIIGLALGSAAINIFIGYQIDELHLNKKELEGQLGSCQKELAELKKNLAEQKNRRLTNIDIHVAIDDNGLNNLNLTKLEQEQIEIEVIKNSKERLASLIGQELSKLNYPQIALVLDGREITFNQQVYLQEVDLIVVTDQIDVYVTVLAQNKLP